MSLKIDIGYLKVRREYDWLMEVVGAEFDGLLNLLNENVIVYGGVVRDCIAGKPLLGDIDLAVTPAAFQSVVQSFRIDPKWVELRKKTKSAAEYATFSSVGDIKEFKNIDGKVAQVMKSNVRGSREDKLYFLARNVDIKCCGLALNHKGEVLELVKGAVKDCINNVLVINPAFKNMSDSSLASRMESRIEKLIGRGWKSEIDLKKLKLMKKKEVKKQEIVETKTTRNIPKAATLTEAAASLISADSFELPVATFTPRETIHKYEFNYGPRSCSEARNTSGSRISRFSIDPITSSGPLPVTHAVSEACIADCVSMEIYENVAENRLEVTLYESMDNAPTVTRLFGVRSQRQGN
jgi:hypothetical protein